MDIRTAFKLSGWPVLIASLCCLSPVILVLLGLGTASFAASLADTLYGEYRWYFRLAGLLALVISLTAYFRRQHNICTLDAAKRERNKIVNTVAIAFFAAVLGYVFFLYVAVHFVGVWLKLWT